MEAIRSQIPLQRLGRPEDIAFSVVYLASPAGDYITGETIAIDGWQQNWGNIDYSVTSV
jgi:NAD(P)-dependent dehydrogenase (short-subunit alcohol dehydrogenase family)